jgi:subtilisin family serine protease
MRPTGPARVSPAALSARLLTLLTAVALSVTALSAAPGSTSPASAATTPLGSDRATVRLEVQTTTGSAAAVTAAAERLGATRVGAVRRLHAVSFEVTSWRAQQVRAALSRRSDVTSVGVAQRRWFTADPDDPRYAEQRTYLSAIGDPAAWESGAVGSQSVRVAIVDSGVDVHHPDLAGKVVGTYNAVTGGTDVHDVVGHGTGTASVAAAATGNGVGIAGSGRDTSILAVKVADVTGRIFTDDLAGGIVWAADHGADIINLSLGGPSSDPLERAAVAYAAAHDVLVVAAAGNEGTSAKQYPASLPGVLAVGATNAAGSARAGFSSFGSWVDLGAPGRSIVVATPGGGYDVEDGTSFSAPLVSGAAALLAAYRPGRTAAQLAQALDDAADTAKLGFARGLVHVDRSLALLPPAEQPAITGPTAGSTVAGQVTVSALTAAPRARLGLGDLRRTVQVAGGVASTTFETFGLSGPQPVTAAACSVVDQCADPTTSSVTVDNGSPTLTAPAPAQDVREDDLELGADAPGGAVQFLVDAGQGGQATVPAAPYRTTLPTVRLGEGGHTVSAVICRSDGSVCDTAHPAQTSVTVTRLHPAVLRIAPRIISPNGDRRQDTATVTYSLDRAGTPTLQVRSGTGVVVLTRSLGQQAAGTHTARWNGRLAAGRVAADGTYQVGVATVDGTLRGLANSTVRVDRAPPRLVDVHRSAPRVLPVHDNYLDTVSLDGRSNEALAALDLRVTTPGGTVRVLHRGPRDLGLVGATWDGRLPHIGLVPGGYRLRLVATDFAGNTTTSAARTVTVSRQQLVRRHGTTTVTAKASLGGTYVDTCSEVFPRTSGRHDGWVAYGASSTCTSDDAFAGGDHQVRLPDAVRYGTVQISAYGGRADRRYRDSARVEVYDSLQNLSDHTFRLSPALGNHAGPRVKADGLLIRDRVLRWMTLTTGVAWYDVKSYTVRFTYFVLR